MSQTEKLDRLVAAKNCEITELKKRVVELQGEMKILRDQAVAAAIRPSEEMLQ